MGVTILSLSFFVLLLHLFDAVVDVSARIGQIALRVVHIVGRNVQVGLRQIELILQRILLGLAGLRDFRGELIDLRL